MHRARRVGSGTGERLGLLGGDACDWRCRVAKTKPAADGLTLGKVSDDTWRDIGSWMSDRFEEMSIDEGYLREEYGPHYLPAIRLLAEQLMHEPAALFRKSGAMNEIQPYGGEAPPGPEGSEHRSTR